MASQPDCKELAVKAAKALSYVINGDDLATVTVEETINNKRNQVFDVTVSDDGSAYITYTVTVDRNVSPIEANQWCSRVSKVEITSEE